MWLNTKNMMDTKKQTDRLSRIRQNEAASALCLPCGYTQDDISTASPEDMNEYYSVEEQEIFGVVGMEIEVF